MKHLRMRTLMIATAAGAVTLAGATVLPAAAQDDGDQPVRGRILPELTDEQRACLDDLDLTRPERPLTAEERQAHREEHRAALESCGIELPERPLPGLDEGLGEGLGAGPGEGHRHGPGFGRGPGHGDRLTLTDEQRACLDDLDLTRPERPLTAEEREGRRAEMREALESCGVELPARCAPEEPAASEDTGS